MKKILEYNSGDYSSIAKATKEIKEGSLKALTLNLSQINFLYSADLVLLKCFFMLCNENEVQVKIMPPENPGAKSYAERMGLFGDIAEKYAAEHSEKFFPLYFVENDHNFQLEEYCSLFFSDCPWNIITDISDSIGEIADNIYFHSGKKENTGKGYVHAQILQEKIIVAVCDLGEGFYTSYQRTGQLKGRNNEQILKDSIKELESCLNGNGENRRGLGIATVVEYIQGGRSLKIISGDTRLEVTKTGVKTYPLSYNFLGSLVKIVF